ncbi:MAG: glucosylceramidase [Oscillospiraceae bacterium]|nr:glucosylceramidase [Oscillospiraceae bacterium]
MKAVCRSISEERKVRFAEQELVFSKGETENKVVNIYPEFRYQPFEGFGGAITEAAAYVYSLMDAEDRKRMMNEYFSESGMDYSYVRIPIDSCDFSRFQYEGFEIVEQYILPMLQDAEAAAGHKLPVMLSPWTPPAKWKDNQLRTQGGKLKPEHYADWAEYLCSYIEWYRNKGFLVTRITLQNEPHAVQTWDSCIYTAQEQKIFLRDHMYPAMQKHGLTDIEIYLWDHNKERVYEWLSEIVDDTTRDMVAGMAFHWYSGDHFDALDLCRQAYPDKKLMVSESCFEYSVYGEIDPVFAAQKFAHEILGDMNHGTNAYTDWNLLLDEQGGPNYVNNFCLAPYLYNTKTNTLERHLMADYIDLLSSTIIPGSVRTAATRYSDQVETTAWHRPDGKLALILMNRQDQETEVCVRLNGEECKVSLKAMGFASLLIEE